MPLQISDSIAKETKLSVEMKKREKQLTEKENQLYEWETDLF